MVEMLKFSFITALQNIVVPENLGRGDKIGDEMWISNDRGVKSRYLNESLKSVIGTLEYNHLEQCNVFVYSSEQVPTETDPVAYLTAKMYCAQDFLMATWLKSDNCINFELCFLIVETESKFGVTSNFLTHRYQSADGRNEELRITRKKLREIRLLHFERLGVKNNQSPIPDLPFFSENSRIGRALSWMNSARGSLDYSVRVSNFCTALETLFSTSNSEIAHQLSERVSIFLEERSEKRIVIYQKLKKAYELRSRILHGSTTIQKPSKNPRDTANEIEEVSKEVILKIIENDALFEQFNDSNERLGKFLLEMTLEGKTPAGKF